MLIKRFEKLTKKDKSFCELWKSNKEELMAEGYRVKKINGEWFVEISMPNESTAA
jgi:hypothetical protein